MRDQLIGYLLDALEPEERTELETALESDESLRSELAILRRSLQPLDANHAEIEPPVGLAERTCTFVAEHAKKSPRMTPDSYRAVSHSRWSAADLVVTVGVMIAISLLFIPAVNQSRLSSRLMGCQNNLRQLGVALASYSDRNDKLFPQVPTKGRMAVAGIYANTLLNDGYLDNPNLVICPGSPLAEKSDSFHIPTVAELREAAESKLAELHRSMGGSYGYTLGYISKGRYHPTKNLNRPHFALMADSPSGTNAASLAVENHGGGQNVLFEDGRVSYLTSRVVEGCGDDIFANDQGEVAAGTHRDDAVIAPSPAKPMIWPVALADE